MKKHLGKGIEALISELNSLPSIETEKTESEKNNNISYINTNKLIPSKWQPRKNFKQESLQQLAQSIQQSGIIEPLIVSPNDNGYFEIICGERRWRAAKLINLREVPVIIKNLDDKQKRLFSLVENIQREDLNPVEEASVYKSLLEEYNLTQEELAQLVGKDRSVLANTIRILSLPKEVLEFIEQGLISAGHARSLASIKDEKIILELSEKIINDKLTVRDVENIVSSIKSKKQINRKEKQITPEVKQLQKELSESIGLKVTIKQKTETKGNLIIYYNSLEEFDKIYKLLKK
ncbi:MAG: ParB/RepB/Spo0J family partition protein [Endomicrobia bacterium]|nr:ParB/RepB/Spo0J family partition protein [Endomicrobiia bacterium]